MSSSTSDELAEPVEAVAGEVGVVVDGQHAQLGAALGVEQHEQPVQVAQALAGELLGVDPVRARRRRPRLAARRCWMTSLARISMLSRMPLRSSLLTRRPRACATCRRARRGRSGRRRLEAGHERVGGEQRGDRLELALGLGVVAFEGGVEVDGEESALGPLGPLGQQHDRAAEHEHEAGRLVDGEQLAHRVGGRGDLLLLAGAFGTGRAAGRPGRRSPSVANRSSTSVGEAGVERDQQQPGGGLDVRG